MQRLLTLAALVGLASTGCSYGTSKGVAIAGGVMLLGGALVAASGSESFPPSRTFVAGALVGLGGAGLGVLGLLGMAFAPPSYTPQPASPPGSLPPP